MSQANKDLARRFYDEAFGRGNMAFVDELVAPDFVDHNPPGPGLPPGREGVKVTTGMFRAAFPDLKFTVEDQIAEGDKVVTRLTARGTHQGDLMGVKPTGKHIEIGVVDIIRVQGGQWAERWGQADFMGMMVQLGVVPPPGG